LPIPPRQEFSEDIFRVLRPLRPPSSIGTNPGAKRSITITPFWENGSSAQTQRLLQLPSTRPPRQHKKKLALRSRPRPENDPPVVITYRSFTSASTKSPPCLPIAPDSKPAIHHHPHPIIPELPIPCLALRRSDRATPSLRVFQRRSHPCGPRAADSGSPRPHHAYCYQRMAVLDHKATPNRLSDRHKRRHAHRPGPHLAPQSGNFLPIAHDHGPDVFVDEGPKDIAAPVEPVSQDAEAPLFLMYTSGTTAAQGAAPHRRAISPTSPHRNYSGHADPKTLLVHADIGWITAPLHLRGRELSRHRSSYEASLNSPTPAPPGASAETPRRPTFSHSPRPSACSAGRLPEPKLQLQIQHMTTVGEPIEPEVLEVVLHVVGKGESVIVRHLVANETAASSQHRPPSIP